MAPWFPALAEQAAADPARRRACILLWMSGGPSQLDTFDPKPEHENGGEFKPIDTSVPGIQICEHLPKIAQQMERMAVIRSMSTKEGDHTRATYLAHTGYLPQGPIRYPTLGSLFSKELGQDAADLPNFVSIAPNRFLSPGAFGPGFLGPQYAPLIVGDPGRGGLQMNEADSLRVRNIDLPRGVDQQQLGGRLGLLDTLETGFAAARPDVTVESHRLAYEKAVRMMRSTAVGAFALDDEDATLRDAYGRNAFGQGCLLARRLVERGVPFVEVSLNAAGDNQGIGWDTHQDNFNGVRQMCEVLDPAWSTLLEDLRLRGLLESTLMIWMGEFGRTPQIAADRTGRDHFPVAWSTALCGGGIRGGQVVGRTSTDGMSVEDRKVSTPDFLATVCRALGVDPATQNISNVGRPIRIADPEATPIEEVLA
ncbi:MAG: DUF1501 domain-containing protein [Planctomycetaceae bacterium]|nr:DUF1501 domain-containing protein [Planctomycetaceae bacterium]